MTASTSADAAGQDRQDDVRPGGPAGPPSRQRAVYEAVVAHREGTFPVERPPLFSPAAGVQDRTATGTYGHFGQMLLPTEYTSWVEETQAHVRSCYLGDWSPLHKIEVTGPQAADFLGWLGMRSPATFQVGRLVHHVQLDQQGRVASEGVLLRVAEEVFCYTAGSGDWLTWQLRSGDWDAQAHDVSPDTFVFGVQGPESLAVLETALGSGLRDLGFSRSREAELAGVPVRVLRTGISGELGYEVHGPSPAGNEVWAALLAAGEPVGIRQLGFRAQPVQHIEAGIATNGLDYLPASIVTPGAPTQFRSRPPQGSFVPTAVTDLFRTPGELGWAPSSLPSHDFLGRSALAAELSAGGSARTLVGLTWDPVDVAAVLGAVVSGAAVDAMELPRSGGLSFDQVLVGDRLVGVSSGRTLSLNLGATISLCVIDRELAAAGTEVAVLWGRPGTAQRRVAATVTPLPFKPDRRRTDVTTLPARAVGR